MRKPLLALLALLLGGLGATSATATPPGSIQVGLPAQVVEFEPDGVGTRSFPTIDFTGEQPLEGTTDWRVVRGTGNAAENWLSVSPEGRIYDLGGRYINFSDDEGETWESVRPLEPHVNGEGSVVMAPNGDVLGVTWDPYSGDRVVTYKYSAADDEWSFMHNPFHTPFWDRPGIGIVVGDFTSPTGEEVPYITFIKGFPHDAWHYSYDGLNYPFSMSLAVDRATNPAISEWLDVEADESFDWIQPNQGGNNGMAALGGGKALLGSVLFNPETMRFHSFSLPEGDLPGGMRHTDSLGRIHTVTRVGNDALYRLSADGGRSWVELELPDIRPGDFRANAAVGVAAVSGVHGTQDVLYKLDISGDAPEIARHYTVGNGDSCRCNGIGFYGLQGGHRFDFHSVEILPDGRLAVSFMDSETTMAFPTLGTTVVSPALAVELDTSFPDPPEAG